MTLDTATYKIVFPHWPHDHPYPDESDLLFVKSETLQPPTVVLHPIVKQFLVSIAKDFAFDVGRDFTKTTSAQLSFSKEQGIRVLSSTDIRIQEIIKNFQMIQISPKMNPIQFLLSQTKDFESQDVNLEIAYVEEIQAMGTTSASMRYPHMYKDLLNRFENIRMNPNTKVCLLGPGLNKPEKGTPISPQFAEMLSLFPNAEFLLLEKDPDLLKVLSGQIKVLGGIAYDGASHRILGPAFQNKRNPIVTPPSYFPLLKEMSISFTNLWKNFAHQKQQKIDEEKMFYGYGKMKTVFLQINPKKVELREGDFSQITLNDEEAGTFDVVIATMSLMYAVEDQPTLEKKKEIFIKYLNLLREGGSMYIDQYLYDTLMDDGLITGLPIICEKIPLSDLQPGLQGDLGQIRHVTLQDQDLSHVVSSTSVWAITKREDTR